MNSKQTVLFIFTVWGESESGTYTYKDSRFTLTMNGETIESDSMISTGDYLTLENNVLTLVSGNLDEIYDDDTGQTYRQAGFTKHETKMTFKK